MSNGPPRRSVPYYDALPDSPAHHVARRSASVLVSHPLGQHSGSASRATSTSTRSVLVCFPVPPDTPRPISRCPELAAACFGSETPFNAPLPLRANLTQPLPLRISPRVSNPAPALHTLCLAPLCRGYSRSGTAPTPDLSALSAVVRLYGVLRSVSALPARRVMHVHQNRLRSAGHLFALHRYSFPLRFHPHAARRAPDGSACESGRSGASPIRTGAAPPELSLSLAWSSSSPFHFHEPAALSATALMVARTSAVRSSMTLSSVLANSSLVIFHSISCLL